MCPCFLMFTRRNTLNESELRTEVTVVWCSDFFSFFYTINMTSLFWRIDIVYDTIK